MELLLKAENIHIEYLDRVILDIPSLEIYDQDRIGIVGNVGVGKTTLLKALMGTITAPNMKVKRYGEWAYFEQIRSAEVDIHVDRTLLGHLGVHNISANHMSGGEQNKYRIAQMLSKDVHGILADEPTCNVDKDGVNYLSAKFNAFPGALVVVSHDRHFLDAVVNQIWELKDGKIEAYYGNFSNYIDQVQERRAYADRQHLLYTKEISRLKNVYDDKVKKAEKVSNKPDAQSGKRNIPNKNDMTRSFGSREKTLYRSANNVISRIENMDKIEKPKPETRIKFRMNPKLELHNKYPIIGRDIYKQFGDRILLQGASFDIPLASKVALTGGNGVGKTTLIRMILNKESGITLSPKALIGYFEQNGYHSIVDDTLIGYVMRDCDYHESVLRSMLTNLGFTTSDLMKNMADLSGGERVKCSLLKILTGRYNILILDEPSNYLDIRSVLALEEFMIDYNGTILFVSHDQRIVDKVADIIYEIVDGKIRTVANRL